MDAPYRETEDRLGKVERENAAVVAFGAWRGRTRSKVLLVFCLGGAGAGLIGYVAMRALMFRMLGVNIIYVSAFIGFVAPFVALAVIGRAISTKVLRRRTPDAIRRLAGQYQVDAGVLAETARAVEDL